MPIKLGEKVQCGTLNAEHDIHCQKLVAEQLEVPELGSLQNPVNTIHRASTDIFQNDLKFVESNSGEARLIIRTDGHLAVSQDVEFYSGTDIETGMKKYSIGLNTAGDKFVIKDEIHGNDILTLDSNGLDPAGTAGLSSALDAKQASLTLPNGSAISTTVLDTFQLVSDGNGPSYNTSLLTAGAIENWFETLQDSLLMIPPGNTGPGYRAASISTTTTPSGVNVPSSLAVSNFVNTKIQDYTSLNATSFVTNNISCSSLRVDTILAGDVGRVVILGGLNVLGTGVGILLTDTDITSLSVTESATIHDATFTGAFTVPSIADIGGPNGTTLSSVVETAINSAVTLHHDQVTTPALSVAWYGINGKAPLNGSSTENFDAQTLTCTSIVATTATLDADLYFDGSGDSLSAQLANKAPTLNPTFSGLMEVPGSSAAHSGTIGSVPNVNGVNNVGFAKTNRFNGTDYAILQYDGGAVNVNASSGTSLSFTKDHVNRMVCGQDGNWTIQTQLTMDGALNSKLIQPVDNGVRTIGTSLLNYATVHARNLYSNTVLQLSAAKVDIGNTSGIGNIELDADLVKITGTLQVPGDLTISGDATFSGTTDLTDLTVTGDITGSGSGLGADHLNIKTSRITDNIELKPNDVLALTAYSNGDVKVGADLDVIGTIRSTDAATRLTFSARPAEGINFMHEGPTSSTETNKLNSGAAARLNQDGKWRFYTQVKFYGGYVNANPSDDRLKINETSIIDALATIRQLSPQRYTRVAKESHTTGWEEAGFIAQSVDKIPELQFTVITDEEEADPDTGETPTGYLALDYNSIFTHLVAAVKELDLVVQQQAARIEILEG